ncbi:hypothetical protein CEXT_631091 [Caerostris extrusa]|uniref:Uncharacterized protein n=1 Tax=Caerostris extrusa TaxID=172846 RepID=A0AAV4PP74_CAEEX|nr:hypothetical protein CEXT_631091 [Caerostris extrusa]
MYCIKGQSICLQLRRHPEDIHTLNGAFLPSSLEETVLLNGDKVRIVKGVDGHPGVYVSSVYLSLTASWMCLSLELRMADASPRLFFKTLTQAYVKA